MEASNQMGHTPITQEGIKAFAEGFAEGKTEVTWEGHTIRFVKGDENEASHLEVSEGISGEILKKIGDAALNVLFSPDTKDLEFDTEQERLGRIVALKELGIEIIESELSNSSPLVHAKTNETTSENIDQNSSQNYGFDSYSQLTNEIIVGGSQDNISGLENLEIEDCKLDLDMGILQFGVGEGAFKLNISDENQKWQFVNKPVEQKNIDVLLNKLDGWSALDKIPDEKIDGIRNAIYQASGAKTFEDWEKSEVNQNEKLDEIGKSLDPKQTLTLNDEQINEFAKKFAGGEESVTVGNVTIQLLIDPKTHKGIFIASNVDSKVLFKVAEVAKNQEEKTKPHISIKLKEAFENLSKRMGVASKLLEIPDESNKFNMTDKISLQNANSEPADLRQIKKNNLLESVNKISKLMRGVWNRAEKAVRSVNTTGIINKLIGKKPRLINVHQGVINELFRDFRQQMIEKINAVIGEEKLKRENLQGDLGEVMNKLKEDRSEENREKMNEITDKINRIDRNLSEYESDIQNLKEGKNLITGHEILIQEFIRELPSLIDKKMQNAGEMEKHRVLNQIVAEMEYDAVKGNKFNSDETKSKNIDETNVETKKVDGKNIKVTTATRQGIGKDELKINQDASLATSIEVGGKEIPIMGVLDGHGDEGHEFSQYIKDNLPSFLKTKMEEAKINPETVSIEDLDNFLTTAFEEFDEKICNELKNKDGGSTMTLCMLFGDELLTINLGDSRAIGIQKDGAVPLSVDAKANHPKFNKTPVNGRIGGQLKVATTLGDKECKLNKDAPDRESKVKLFADNKVDITSVKIPNLSKGGELDFIIASDGLWDVARNQDVAKLVSESKNKENVAQDLLKRAVQAESTDDITVAHVRIGKPLWKRNPDS